MVSIVLKRRISISLVAVLALFAAGTGHAGAIQNIQDECARRFKSILIDPNIKDYAEQTLTLQRAGGDPVLMTVDNRLGSGWFGGVYRIDSIAGVEGLDPTEHLVAKMPHAWKFGSSKPFSLANKTLSGELENYELVQGQISKIEADPKYPKDPAWDKDYLPVAPIRASLTTDLGNILIKPELKGMTLSKIYERYGTQIPKEMEDGLRDIFDLTQAVHDTVNVQVKYGIKTVTEGYSADVRGDNLIWIEDPETLAKYHLKRPGFILFEFGQVPGNMSMFLDSKITFEQYLNSFKKYLTLNGTKVPANGPTVSKGFLLKVADVALKNPLEMIKRIHAQYGDTAVIPRSKGNVILNDDPELITAVLKSTDSPTDRSFKKSPIQFDTITPFVGKDNLLTADGSPWRNSRKQYSAAFTPKNVETDGVMTPMTEVVDGRIAGLQSRMNGKDVNLDLSREMTTTTLNIILKVMFGTAPEEAKMARLANSFDTIYRSLPFEAVNLTGKPIHELPNILPFQRKLKAAHADVDSYVEELVRQQKALPDSKRTMFAQMILNERDEAGNPISHEAIKNQIKTFIFAGHETTSSLLGWTFYSLEKNPETKQKLLQEIEKLGGKTPTLGDMKSANLPYLDQVLTESLRLHPPIYVLSREAVKDVSISTQKGVVRLSKGDHLMMCPYLSQRNEANWGRARTGYPADVFAPDRFDPTNLKAHGTDPSDMKITSFGSGPRVCIGQYLAIAESKLVLVRYLQSFKMSLANPDMVAKETANLSYHLDEMPVVLSEKK